WAILEMPTDNMHTTGYFAIGGMSELNNMAFSQSNPLLAAFWLNTYNGIFRANSVLANIDNPVDYKVNQKEQFVGEAKFMRALFYFDLVRMFGGVPKVTSLLSIDVAKTVTKASEDEIYALIIEDLKDAVDKLPTKTGIAKGRASKGAAIALLSKVYVYRKDWANAKIYLDMMPAHGYQLLPAFADLWKLDKEDNNEVIFAMKYTGGTNGHTLSSDFIPYFGVAGIAPAGNENAFPSWSLHKLYQTDDTRKTATITEYWKSPAGPPAAPAIWYPYISKYAVAHTQNSSGLDLPVIRYADVVLLNAEVLYRLNKPDLALVELNKVRERAFGGTARNYTLADIATLETFMDKLLLERQLEFAFENERWYDLVRTDRFMTVLKQVEMGYNNATQTPQVVNLSPQPYHKYFPIPQTEIEKSNGALVQNDGYN
ncbi:MAG TPA: RagB/SusD family nutrient uptake outer membrane protein, partial [Sphingobacteriaceae bacterium]